MTIKSPVTPDPVVPLPLPDLIIFDKDGTLIEFHAMWSDWIEQLAARLAAAAGRPLAPDYLTHIGYDTALRRTLAGGRLAKHSMADFHTLTVEYLHSLGVPDAARVTAEVWSVPDPIH